MRNAPPLIFIVAAAETEEETVNLMREAIEFHIKGLREDKLPIPEPMITAKCVDVVV